MAEKSAYEKKITELNQQISEKAKELQSVSEQIQQTKRKKEDILLNVKDIEKDLIKISQKRSDAVLDIDRWRVLKNKEIIEHELRIKDKIKQIDRLELQRNQLDREVNLLRQVKVERLKQEKMILDLLGEIKELGLEKTELFKDYSILEKEKKMNEQRLALMRGKSEKIYQSLVQIVQNVKVYQRAIKPYISIIVSWCVAHNEKPPELLENYKPKILITTKEIRKKIKDKQK